jgi:hypothetical protein
MVDISQIIKEEGHIRKYEGIAPEGFQLVHNKTLDDLRDYDNWIEWRNGRKTIKELNKINFDNT